ncbi:MAG: hypothetical protein ABIP27_16775 [Flavobacterium circumlabens]|uniref:hypothetical protein n=1 Tax=Flavobacterium circumlabens TaxID=2133765 RepID=UPI003264F401
MNTINEILGITAEQFELDRFNAYWKWCEKLTANNWDAQKVVAYPPLSRYYNAEIAKCEAEFRERMKNYQDSKTVTVMDRKRLYERCTEIVHQTCRPIPLINEAIRSQTVSKDLNMSVFCVAVRGVKLDSIILRLN